jgi:hypothetical protein
MAVPFISRADLGELLGQDLTTSDKALIAIDSACDIVRDLAEQTFNLVEDETITLDGTGTDALLLPERPVTEIGAVVEGDETLVVGDDYVLNGQGVLLRKSTTTTAVWAKGRQNVQVTYSHGYSTNTLPRSVRAVALQIAARLFQQKPGVTSESLGQRSVRFSTDSGSEVTKNEERILAKYRV